MSSHAESGDCTSGPVGNGAVVFVYVFDELFSHEGFITIFGIGRTVPIPAVFASIRADCDALHLRDILRQFGTGLIYIDCIISAMTVEQIDYRIFFIR